MGIDLDFRGQMQRPLSSRGVSTDSFAQTLQTFAASFGASVHRAVEGDFLVEICPVGYINMKFRNGTIQGDSRTIGAGPGFHRAVVDFLEGLGGVLGVRWEVNEDTNFWISRNFAQLRQAHLRWLGSLIRFLLQQGERPNAGQLISWPIGSWSPCETRQFVTPMGDFDYEQLTAIKEESRIEKFARDYFIWFNQERDAYFHRGVALYLMWNDCCWVLPRTDGERRLMERILHHLDRARHLDSSIPLPIPYWQELLGLIDRPASEATGRSMEIASGLGYRRREIIAPFAANWTACLPGRFLEENVDGSPVYWDVDREFRLTAYTGRGNAEFVEAMAEPCEEGETLVEHEAEGHQFRGKNRFVKDPGDEQPCWALNGQVLRGSQTAMVTVTWSDEKWTEWAVEAFKSVRNSTPQ